MPGYGRKIPGGVDSGWSWAGGLATGAGTTTILAVAPGFLVYIGYAHAVWSATVGDDCLFKIGSTNLATLRFGTEPMELALWEKGWLGGDGDDFAVYLTLPAGNLAVNIAYKLYTS
jgi:hypothetical protein